MYGSYITFSVHVRHLTSICIYQFMYDIFHITSLCINQSMYDIFHNIYLPVYVKILL